MNIPNDPFILVSYINTQLRDHYSSLEDLCKNLNLSKEALKQKLDKIDYHYEASQNQFI